MRGNNGISTAGDDAQGGSPPLAREQQQKKTLKYAFPHQPILILIHLYLFRRILFLTLIPYVDITDALVLHLQALYEGMLKVTNKVVFCHTLTEGIGKKKAYGFGLMTVIPM